MRNILLIGALVDGPVAQNFDSVAAMTLFILVKLCLIVFFSPLFLLPCLVVILIGFWCGNVYNKTVLSVKREMNNARAPVLAHFGAAIAGLGKLFQISACSCTHW